MTRSAEGISVRYAGCIAHAASTREHRVYNHLLGESSVLFFATERLSAGCRRGCPKSLDGAPMLLPTQNTSLRRSLDGWFAEREIRPNVVGEFEDSALM